MCPYHNWAYNLSGRLVLARHMKGTKGFKASKTRLKPIAVAREGQFIFLNFGADPLDAEAAQEDLTARFGGMWRDVLQASVLSACCIVDSNERHYVFVLALRPR